MPWTTIDCQYLFPRFAASFLKVVKGKAIFIENNTVRAISRLLEALKNQQIGPRDVEYLMVTHAHLDHAGATGALIKLCPQATVLAHPKAAKVLINPSKLIEGAKKVYGEKQFQELYHSIDAVPSERVRAITDGERISWQGESYTFFYTTGHASHHLCILDETENAVFTGDSFGLCYPDLIGKTSFHIPSTSPIDFDYEAAIDSIDKIIASGAQTAFLTHYGPVGDLKDRGRILKKHLLFHKSLVDRAIFEKVAVLDLKRFIFSNLERYFLDELKAAGIEQTKEVVELLKLDLELNADGLVYCALKRIEEGTK
jgi:glyoxylase-like metal-dependent hydrolase (beta-lactamase superfamily II)